MGAWWEWTLLELTASVLCPHPLFKDTIACFGGEYDDRML